MKGLTDLQLILIAGGAILILFIIIYNRINASRLKKKAAAQKLAEETARLAAEAEDQVEPGGLMAEVTAGLEENKEPTLETETIVPLPEFPVDDIIECVITLTPDEDVPAEKVLPLIGNWQQAIKMPVRFVGLTTDDGGQKSWHAIEAGKSYSQFRACVLLANRNAQLTDIEFSTLVARLNQIALAIDAAIDVPDMSTVIDHAKQLHDFVAGHDAKVWLCIQPNGSLWTRAQIEEVLKNHGYQTRFDGTWVKNDPEEGAECELFLVGTFSRKDSDSILSLILFLDVPCIPREKDPFGQMIACARMLCTELDGTLVDEKGKALGEEDIAEIAGQLDQYYQVLQSASLHAGSLRSLRLFRLQAK
jgi:hypothetical protein